MNKIFLLIPCIAIILFTNAQHRPLQGSGKIVTKTFDFKDFAKIALFDMDGNATVEAGKTFSISISIDDNLEKLLSVNPDGTTLYISLKGNRNNKLYIENTNIKIQITLPKIIGLHQDGNNNTMVNSINSEFFKIKCSGNGNVKLNGIVDKLEIICTSNASVHAEKLLAKNVQVTKRGNGNVYTNTDNAFTANSSGNGNIINSGKGIADENTVVTGNGKIKYPNIKVTVPVDTMQPTINKNNLVNVVLKNFNTNIIFFTVKYPVSGSYGISVNAKDSLVMKLPMGTKIYLGSGATLLKAPKFIVKSNSLSQVFIIR